MVATDAATVTAVETVNEVKASRHKAVVLPLGSPDSWDVTGRGSLPNRRVFPAV